MPIHPLLSKLNLQPGTIGLVLNVPDQLQWLVGELRGNGPLLDIALPGSADFVLAFVTRQAEIEAWAPVVAARTSGDARIWFAYPKVASKNYQCDFNRDRGWDTLGQLGFYRARQIALDADWTALRFRHAEFAKRRSRRLDAALPPAASS